MKKMHMQAARLTFYSDVFGVPAKTEVAHLLPLGGCTLIAMTSIRYDTSNAFDVELFDEAAKHFAGKLTDLTRHLLVNKERGFKIAEGGATLIVRNPFDTDLICPRLRFECS